MAQSYPTLRSVVLDTTDARRLAELYRQILAWEYRPGDEPPAAGDHDAKGQGWLLLVEPEGRGRLAFQQVGNLPPSTWPDDGVPQQVHLDFSVPTAQELQAQDERAWSLGARLLYDRFDDPNEPLYVYADLDGHPSCIFVAPEG
jgi:hypothetical protein